MTDFMSVFLFVSFWVFVTLGCGLLLGYSWGWRDRLKAEANSRTQLIRQLQGILEEYKSWKATRERGERWQDALIQETQGDPQ